jgi:CRP/FNR family transcriptional regulator
MDISKRIGTFFSSFPPSRFPKGRVIVTDSGITNQVYYIESGFVIEYHISQSGELLIAHLYQPGSFFPLGTFCNVPFESGYFEALSPTVIRTAPVKSFTEFFLTDRELLVDFTNRLSHNIYNLTRRLGMIASGNAYQKTASALVYLAENLGRRIGGNGTVIIDYDLTHKEIAAWIGSARETTSVQMKLLQRKGLVTYNRRQIVINDLTRLISETGQEFA